MIEGRFGSPAWITDALQAHFGAFDLDAAAEPWSAVVPRYTTKEQDVFKVRPAAKHAYGNWDYSKGQLGRFVPFARESVLEGRWREVTQLVPLYWSEGWFRHVLKPAGRVGRSEFRFKHLSHERLAEWTRYHFERLVVDVIPIAKRVEFRYPPGYTGARETARFSSVVVRFVSPDVADR